MKDKVYVRIAAGDDSGTASVVKRPFTQPYIRVGALLDWAKKQQMESTTILADDWWQKVIEKIESL